VTSPVTDADLASLPESAQRYLRFMGVVGRRRDSSLKAHFTGRFRLGPGKPWMRCEAWQYNSNRGVTRLFHMRIDVAGVIPMFGWDTYSDGQGRMRGMVLGLVTVADGSGPEFDLGELTTCLNDALMLATSMLLDPSTSWSAVDDDSFDVSLTDTRHTVTARVSIDERGALCGFNTRDRYCALPGGLVRAEWTMPVDGWETIAGRPLASGGRATWHLPDGAYTYIEGRFDPRHIQFDVAAPRRRLGVVPRGSHRHAGRQRLGHRHPTNEG
jgi:hypothetical protein